MAAQFRLTAHRVSTPAGMAPCLLGESPTWDEQHNLLWWIDIVGEKLCVGQPTPGSGFDFDRVAVLPVPGHRPGFLVHAPADVADCSDGAGSTTASPYHAVWGSQLGLFCSVFSTEVTWLSAGHSRLRRPLSSAVAFPHCRLAHFPTPLHTLQEGRVYRFNDGKVGPDGSLWCGGLMERTKVFPKRDPVSGTLMKWQPKCPVAPPQAASPEKSNNVSTDGFSIAVPQVTISNGLGWSPSGDTFYHIDSATDAIRAYRYHEGMLGRGRVFWTLPPALKARGASLDGLCVDASGALWVALPGIGEIVRLQSTTEGTGVEELVTVAGVVQVPGVKLCTSCCFGGADLTTLYITTARGTSREAADKCTQDGAGWVYAVNLKGIAKGMPPSRLQIPLSALAVRNSSHL